MDDIDMVDQAYNICIREKNEYMSNRFKKWFVFGFGVVLSVGLAYATTEFVSVATNAVYDRSGLEEGTDQYFGNRTFDDIAVDELMINAYEFNSQQPRFYSKYFRKTRKGSHNVMLKTAMAGSGAAPIYFDPETHKDDYGIWETVIDGGIICNNPELFAYMMAKYLKGHKNVRVLALGTGRNYEKINKTLEEQGNYNKFNSLVSTRFL
jgi:patatin-like phospholipase/acyl hydrolase